VLVSGWRSGTFVACRAIALGVRVGRENVERFFDKGWNVVLVQIDSDTIAVKIRGTLWRTCPELRSPAIGAWMKKKGLVPWLKGRPPEMRLTPMGGNRFRLDV
jgi:hypothetical protein